MVFVFVCIGILGGVFLGSFVSLDSSWVVSVGVAVSFMLAFLVLSNRKGLVLLVMLLVAVGFSVGLWRSEVFDESIDGMELALLNDQGEVELEVEVVGYPESLNDRARFEVASGTYSGKALVTVGLAEQVLYGDRLKLRGELKSPGEFQGFDYRAYLERRGIGSVMYYPAVERVGEGGSVVRKRLFGVRSRFESMVNRVLPEPEASFLAGLLLGVKRGLPDEVMESLNKTGMTHVIALSGYNITIIAMLFVKMLAGRFHFRVAFVMTVVGIVGFVLMTSTEASIVRAAIMGVIVLVAKSFGRLSSIKNALILAAVIMVMVNPRVLVFDVGFQLSFLATIGLVYVSPFFERLFRWMPRTFELRDSAALSVSAQIMTAPVVMLNFARISVVAPVVNVMILPLIPLTMFLGFVSGVAGLVWVRLGELVSVPAWALLHFELWIVEVFSRLKMASFVPPENVFYPAVMTVVVLACFGIVLRMTKKMREVAR